MYTRIYTHCSEKAGATEGSLDHLGGHKRLDGEVVFGWLGSPLLRRRAEVVGALQASIVVGERPRRVPPDLPAHHRTVEIRLHGKRRTDGREGLKEGESTGCIHSQDLIVNGTFTLVRVCSLRYLACGGVGGARVGSRLDRHPGFGFRVSYFVFRISYFGFRISG